MKEVRLREIKIAMNYMHSFNFGFCFLCLLFMAVP